MESFHCIVDKSGSMSVLDKSLIIQNLNRTLKQVLDYSSEEDKFEIQDIDWDGNSESLIPLIKNNKISRFLIMTDGYSFDELYKNSLKRKEFQQKLLELNVIGCVVLIGIDANEERIPVIETFPSYDVLEALEYVLQK